MVDNDHNFWPAAWPFPDSPNTMVLTTRRIVNDGAAIVAIAHEAAGEWQFLDGGSVEVTDGLMFCLHCLATNHPDILAFGDLPEHWDAWLTEDGTWTRQPFEG